MDKNFDKVQMATNLMNVLNDLEAENETVEVLKDNELVFSVEGKCYRMHKPKGLEQRRIDEFRRKKYTELLKDDSYMFKKQWIENYKAKGIDIQEKQSQIATYMANMNQVLLRLAVATDPKDIESLKQEVTEIKHKQYELSVEIANLLSDSIESTLMIAVNLYTGYCVLEVKEEEYKPAFTSFEEFQSLEGPLVNKVIYYLNCLIYTGKELYELPNTPKNS